MFNQRQRALAQELKQMTTQFSLESRLANYEDWIKENPNASQQSISWHWGQIARIKEAITAREKGVGN